MKRFTASVRSLLGIPGRIKGRMVISGMCGDGDEALKALGLALRETVGNDIDPAEQAWIDSIESLRDEMNSSSEKIAIEDFGAGSPDDGLTESEMYEGKVIEKTVGAVCRSASRSYLWSVLLFKLVRKAQPSVCLELGTCLGVSAAFQAAALKINGAGTIVTLEGAKSLAALAERNFEKLGLDNARVVVGRFQDTLGGVLDEYGRMDLAFIDGHHDEKATIEYYRQILPFLSERAIVVFDDINWSAGMNRAWKTIIADDRVGISVDLRQIGICVLGNTRGGKRNLSLVLE
jgi:hypothetical protein